jgi:putative cell wall-binding protein
MESHNHQFIENFGVSVSRAGGKMRYETQTSLGCL